MDWTEIIVQVASDDAELAAAVASMTASYGLYIEDYADMEATLPQIGWVDDIDEELLARDRETARIHMYLPKNQNPAEAAGFITARLSAEGVAHTVDSRTVREADWQDSWKQYYKPLRVGERIVVRPTWEPYDAQPGDVVVDLDPGSAFGTGSHETTRLCLELLEQVVSPDDAVLDMGCGSGILSIAALKLGARRAVGVDIEQNAAATAARNASANGVGGDRYRTLWGDALADPALYKDIGGKYDVIAANIVADVILSMKALFYDKLRPGGRLVVSGIIGARANEVLAALEQQGFVSSWRLELNDWVAAALAKPE